MAPICATHRIARRSCVIKLVAGLNFLAFTSYEYGTFVRTRTAAPSKSCRQIGGIRVDDITVLILSAAVLFLAAAIYRLISKL